MVKHTLKYFLALTQDVLAYVDHFVGTCRYRVTIAEQSQSVITCSKLTIETVEQDLKYVQS